MTSKKQLRKIALALPGVEERKTWGHPTFRIRDQIFVGLAADGPTARIKATKKQQAKLLKADPDTYAVAAYVGRYGWIEVDLRAIDGEQVQALVVQAWRQTAPRTMVKKFDAR